MSGLALVLHSKGYLVSGSDAQPSVRVARLRRMGIPVHIGHDAALVRDAEFVVYNTDIPHNNPELVAARDLGICIRHRSEVLAWLLNEADGIAISGTHGKTTTTAMIAHLAQHAGLDPTCLIGGELASFGGTARLGHGPHLIAEVDESDASFLRYRPRIAVILNIEPEHLEHYDMDFDNVKLAFAEFISQVKPGGLVVACADSKEVMEVLARSNPSEREFRVVLYGFSPHAFWRANNVKPTSKGMAFSLLRGDKQIGQVELPVPGRHNVSNALAALAVGDFLGIHVEDMIESLRSFRNAQRRFQVVAQTKGITIVDDFAHHPTEIRATIDAARAYCASSSCGTKFKNRRIIAVFQPHRYSRTATLLSAFATAFDDVDELILADIYSPPGETALSGVSSDKLANLIQSRTGKPVHRISTVTDIVQWLASTVQPGDLVLVMGAGNVGEVASRLASLLTEGATLRHEGD